MVFYSLTKVTYSTIDNKVSCSHCKIIKNDCYCISEFFKKKRNTEVIKCFEHEKTDIQLIFLP